MTKLKYLHTYRDKDGTFRAYVRRVRSSRIPIKGRVGTPSFMAAYRAAVKKVGGTITEKQSIDGAGVYFIRSGELIKIGWTLNVAVRFTQLQTGSSEALELLLVVPGERKDEREMHRKFQGVRVRGEWFHGSPELLAFIEGERMRADEMANASG